MYGAHSSSRHVGLSHESYTNSLLKEQLAPSRHRPAIQIYISLQFNHWLFFLSLFFLSPLQPQCQPHNHKSKQKKRTVFPAPPTYCNQSFNGMQLLQSSKHLFKMTLEILAAEEEGMKKSVRVCWQRYCTGIRATQSCSRHCINKEDGWLG